jgi:hypothetical protein
MRQIAKLLLAASLLALTACTASPADSSAPSAAPSTSASINSCAQPDFPVSGANSVGPTFQPPASVEKVTFGTPCGYFQADFPVAVPRTQAASVLETTLKDDDGRPIKDYHTILNNYQLDGQPLACPQCEEFSVFVQHETNPASSLESHAQDCSTKAGYQHHDVAAFNRTGEPAFVATCQPFGPSGLTRELAVLRHHGFSGDFRYEVVATAADSDIQDFLNSFQLNG